MIAWHDLAPRARDMVHRAGPIGSLLAALVVLVWTGDANPAVAQTTEAEARNEAPEIIAEVEESAASLAFRWNVEPAFGTSVTVHARIMRGDRVLAQTTGLDGVYAFTPYTAGKYALEVAVVTGQEVIRREAVVETEGNVARPCPPRAVWAP